MTHHLIHVWEQIGHPNILVVGDLILDRYVWGDAERISQEAPVILLREQGQENRLGGAANVAHMLRGLEASVTLAGVTGADADADIVVAELQVLGVETASIIPDAQRSTTVKIRFMGRAHHRHPHQMLRVDREQRTPIRAEIAQQILQTLLPRLPEFDAVLVSDYAKGVCTADLLGPLIAAARAAEIPVVVDPASGGDYRHYCGATGVTPNRLETFKATGIEIHAPDDAHRAATKLVEDFELDMAFVTIDRDGIVLGNSDGSTAHLATRVREVCDVTGAGDMVLATIGLGMAAGIDPVDICRLANVAGGLEVEQVGVVPITRRQILHDLWQGLRATANKVCDLDSLRQHLAERRRQGQKVVFTNGCFDLLHAGHISYLQEAARAGDCLVVAVNSDDSVRRLAKGPDRPLFAEEYRAQMLAALEVVDYVIVFSQDTPHELLRTLQPDILVKGGTYAESEIVGREVVLGYGGRVKALGALPGLSTTDIVHRLRRWDAEPTTIQLPDVTTERKAA
jgi:D-beta-D-heptose 7-phosphate kinase/D-beta-D-heptose 1-phosphate adenosyltransferase